MCKEGTARKTNKLYIAIPIRSMRVANLPTLTVWITLKFSNMKISKNVLGAMHALFRLHHEEQCQL